MGKTELERKVLENEYIMKAGPYASEEKLNKIRGGDNLKTPIVAEVLSEREVEDFSVQTVIKTMEIKENGDIVFPILEPMADQLEAEFYAKGITPELELTDRDTYQEAKRMRAFVNKTRKEFEDSRKEAKRIDNRKHDALLDQSRKTVLKVTDELSNSLNNKIKEYEERVISETIAEVNKYYDELVAAHEYNNVLKHIPLKTLDIKIGINTTLNQAIKQIEEALEPIINDCRVIDMQDDKERYIEAYVNTIYSSGGYDLPAAMQKIKEEDELVERLAKEKIEKEMKKVEEAKKEVEEKPVIQSSPEDYQSKEVASPSLHVTVELKGDLAKLEWLMATAEENGIEVVSTKVNKDEPRFF